MPANAYLAKPMSGILLFVTSAINAQLLADSRTDFSCMISFMSSNTYPFAFHSYNACYIWIPYHQISFRTRRSSKFHAQLPVSCLITVESRNIRDRCGFFPPALPAIYLSLPIRQAGDLLIHFPQCRRHLHTADIHGIDILL